MAGTRESEPASDGAGGPEHSTRSGAGSRQSRRMALVEALTNVSVGYGLAVVIQVVVFPPFGLHASVGETLAIGAVFTGLSVARSYLLRRVFERLRVAAS